MSVLGGLTDTMNSRIRLAPKDVLGAHTDHKARASSSRNGEIFALEIFNLLLAELTR